MQGAVKGGLRDANIPSAVIHINDVNWLFRKEHLSHR